MNEATPPRLHATLSDRDVFLRLQAEIKKPWLPSDGAPRVTVSKAWLDRVLANACVRD